MGKQRSIEDGKRRIDAYMGESVASGAGEGPGSSGEEEHRERLWRDAMEVCAGGSGRLGMMESGGRTSLAANAV